MSAPNYKNVLSNFEEQSKLAFECIGVSQRWSLYYLGWLCIYSGGQTGHTIIWTLSWIWPWRSRTIAPKIVIKTTKLQICTKYVSTSIHDWLLIAKAFTRPVAPFNDTNYPTGHGEVIASVAFYRVYLLIMPYSQRVLNLTAIAGEVCIPKCPNLPSINTGKWNKLVPPIRQAFSFTTIGLVCWRNFASSDYTEMVQILLKQLTELSGHDCLIHNHSMYASYIIIALSFSSSSRHGL